MSFLNKEFTKLLLESPDTQLDASMKPLIEKWSDPPKAVQILEVLDRCIFSSLASGFIVKVFQMAYADALVTEKTTHDELLKLATWRDNL